MKLALAGNPNSGKTSLYNALTGKLEKVGNWAGVTIEKKESKLKDKFAAGSDITIVDLPGAYSMSPFTLEESITRDFVTGEKPDVIINIVDATSLSRSLFFTSQLLELNIPVIIALNKSDLNKKKHIKIDSAKLAEKMNCQVVETVATTEEGLADLITIARAQVGKSQVAPFKGDIAQGEKAVIAADQKRFDYIKGLVSQVETRTASSGLRTTQDKIDSILAHKWLGVVIFAAVMWSVFSISQNYLGPIVADALVGWLEGLQGMVATALEASVSPIVASLLVDGVIGGVIAVIGFLPLIMVMFFLLALLEDCGYMARVATVMDRFFKIAGLSGKSIIPMVIGTACAIPGVMASRTIRDERQRRTTALITPFMPCGAKLPVIALFAGAFFQDAAWVGTLMYFVGIFLIIVSALVIVRVTGEKHTRSFFIMEMPEYKVPSLKRATISMLSRAKAFIIKATTIILICNLLVHVMQTFDWSFTPVAEGMEDSSILASISSPFAYLLIPLGFGTWQLAAAAITGFIAKENVVGTLAVVFSITNFIDTDELALVGGATEVAATMELGAIAALAYLMFNLYTPPCFAAIGAINAEVENKKWLWGGLAMQFGVGYVVAFLVYQFGTLFTTGSIGAGFVPGLIVTAALFAVVIMLVRKGNEKSAQKAMLKSAA